MSNTETIKFTCSTTSKNHEDLKRLAKEEGLALSQYLVLKGLNKLKES